MTSYQVIFDAFLSKIREDSWCNSDMSLQQITADWESIMESALPWFKMPKHSLKRVGNSYDNDEVVFGYFEEDLDDREIQIIAVLMKWQWLDRTINSWQNVKVMYDERDFSHGNLLNNFIKLLDEAQKEGWRLQKLYNRTSEDENGRRTAWKFSSLAGRGNGN